MRELAERHAGQTILLVVHGGVLMSPFHWTLGIPPSELPRYSLFNGSINRFSVHHGEWKLDTWGDISHLHGMIDLDDI